MYVFLQFGYKGKTFYENGQAFCLFFVHIVMIMYCCCIIMILSDDCRCHTGGIKKPSVPRWSSQHAGLVVAARCDGHRGTLRF